MAAFLLVLALAANPAAGDSLAWRPLPQALEAARRSGRPVLVYVRASWCGPCRRMERDVFPEVAPLLGRFALARLDYADRDGRIEVGGVVRSPAAWARRLGAGATPAFVLLAPDGTPVAREAGFLDARGLGLLLAYVATGAYRHADFEDYARRTTGAR